MITTPVRLAYEHTASPAETAYLHGLAQGRLLGQRCPVCRQGLPAAPRGVPDLRGAHRRRGRAARAPGP